ncbi:uncharacterized protein LAJ45_04611 [Morchella importuna]|uniref:uncharacterized protein n=1 Tax=Morchella importuna TaxID=1174673 RepID=UPI001E8DD7C0|nr:uncharacterized protein LAJ45_04611 [Morchella importuna]KAH8151407.1 hypothetical protein LAJ45_04611 [Morchella importuna]
MSQLFIHKLHETVTEPRCKSVAVHPAPPRIVSNWLGGSISSVEFMMSSIFLKRNMKTHGVRIREGGSC